MGFYERYWCLWTQKIAWPVGMLWKYVVLVVVGEMLWILHRFTCLKNPYTVNCSKPLEVDSTATSTTSSCNTVLWVSKYRRFRNSCSPGNEIVYNTRRQKSNFRNLQQWAFISRPSLIRKFYQQKQFRHSDLSVIFVSSVLIGKHKNSANHISQMENVWSSQHRIFVFNKNAFSVFLSSLDHCLLSTALLPWQRIVTMAPKISSFSMMRNDASHNKAVQLKCMHVRRQW